MTLMMRIDKRRKDTMEKKLLLAPSMGCCDLYDFGHQVKFIDEHADFLHIDIKDGNYVKTFGVGPDFMTALKKVVKKPMDAHLMVKHPQDYIEACAAAGAAYITPHTDCIESDAFVTINKIISLGCKAGIAMNPAAPLEAIRYYLPLLSKVTIMIVDAGYAGQKVITQMYDKIRTLVKWREEMGLDFLIEADGSMQVFMLLFMKRAQIWSYLDLRLFGIKTRISKRRGRLWNKK